MPSGRDSFRRNRVAPAARESFYHFGARREACTSNQVPLAWGLVDSDRRNAQALNGGFEKSQYVPDLRVGPAGRKLGVERGTSKHNGTARRLTRPIPTSRITGRAIFD
jgi:hypothetical protein